MVGCHAASFWGLESQYNTDRQIATHSPLMMRIDDAVKLLLLLTCVW